MGRLTGCYFLQMIQNIQLSWARWVFKLADLDVITARHWNGFFILNPHGPANIVDHLYKPVGTLKLMAALTYSFFEWGGRILLHK